jgi:hypothetical protein
MSPSLTLPSLLRKTLADWNIVLVYYFEVSVEDFQIVKRFQAFSDLDENIPNVWFWNELPLFLVFEYFLKQITVVDVFHYDARNNICEQKP